MKLNNIYYMLRHGQAISNTKEIMSSWPETFENPLTEAGVAMAKEAALRLGDKSIDLIFSSDVLRAKQTAKAVAQALGKEVMFDARLREIDFGSLNGKGIAELRGMVDGMQHLDEAELKRRIKPGGKMLGYRFAGGEDYRDVSDRMHDFLQDVDKQHNGKTILIVSHQSPLALLEERAKGIGLLQIFKEVPGYQQMHTGEVRELVAAVPEDINQEASV